MSYYIAIKASPREMKHFKVPEEVYTYIRQLELALRYSKNLSGELIKPLDKLYPGRFSPGREEPSKMIEIMNLRKTKPSEKWDFIVDRRTPLGNPHFMRTEKDRDLACDKYEVWFSNLVKQKHLSSAMEMLSLLVSCYKLYGRLRLFCWCVPKRCHAETIRRYILRERGEDGES